MTPRMIRMFVSCSIAASCVLGSDALAQVTFSEIRVDQPGLDLSEYVELRGPAGTSLAGLFVVVIGDDDFAAPPAQNGRVESVVALQGSIGASGVFLVAESTYQFGTPDQVAVLNFENPDNVTFLLVSGFTGVDGQFLDTDFNGTLDVTPWTSVLIPLHSSPRQIPMAPQAILSTPTHGSVQLEPVRPRTFGVARTRTHGMSASVIHPTRQTRLAR